MSRTQQSLKRLVACKAKRQDHQLGKIGPPSEVAFDCHVGLSKEQLEQIAAPPCFISAILDVLFSSSYASVTTIVPGEADSYCAEAARAATHAFIFTGDSDLLVQDVGPEGRVVIFKDVEFEDTGGQSHLKVLQHHPSGLAHTLGVSDLIPLAYFVKQRYHRTLLEAATLAKLQSPVGQAYDEFRTLYLTHGETTEMMSSLKQHGRQDVMPYLERQDPRLLELVLQLQIKPLLASKFHSPRTIYFFLPFLLEDPTRASAFQPSMGLLRLTYSVLKFIDCDLDNVTEYTRRGLAVTPAAVMVYGTRQTVDEIKDTVSWLHAILETYPTLPSPARWRMVAVAAILDSLRSGGKILPRQEDITATVLNSTWPKLSWGLLHIKAQMQAIIFTLKLASQILGLLFLLAPQVALSEEQRVALQSLHSILSTLPAIADVFDWKDATAGMTKDEVSEMVDTLARLIGSTVEEDDGFQKQDGKRKKKKKGTTSTAAGAMPAQTTVVGNNQFALLSNIR